MNCPELEQELMSLLDGNPAALTEAVRDHARQCPHCRELLAGAELLRTLPQDQPLTPVAGFAERVTTAVLQEQRRTLRLRWSFALAAAASVLLAIGIWQGINWAGKLGVQPEIVEHVPAPTPPPPSSPPPSLQQAREIGLASLERTRQAAEDAARRASILMPPAGELAATNLAVQPPSVPVPDMGKSVSDGLEPVTKSTRRAFDVWLNLIPMGGDDKPGL
jgi:hypothetical protein